MPATAHTTSAKLLATSAIAPPVLVDPGAEADDDPVGAPPLPPTAELLPVEDAPVLVADRVALLIVVLRAMLAPVPADLPAVPTTVGLDVAEAVEFLEADEETVLEEIDAVDKAVAETEDDEPADEEPKVEPEGAPPVTVIMPV